MRSDATDTENSFPSAQQANLDLVMRVGTLIQTGFADSDEEVFAVRSWRSPTRVPSTSGARRIDPSVPNRPG